MSERARPRPFRRDRTDPFCYNFTICKEPMAPTGKEESALKQHRFWAWAAVICMVMVMVTGYKRK